MARRGIARETERLVRERAAERCEYCRSPEEFSPDTFAIEHIHPRALGGSNQVGNLAFACQGCNGPKGARQHLWREHFRWGDNSLELEGTSAIGRATIELLRLNRRGVMNLRRLLIADEKHPPID